MDVGKRIVELRTARNMTTNKLANLSCVSQSYLRDVELGNKNPTVEFLSYICYGLGISLAGFFSENENENEINPLLMNAIGKLTQVEQLRLTEFLAEIKK